MRSRPALVSLVLFGLLFGCTTARADYAPIKMSVPEPKREFRAAWIATVHNLDWPSTPGLSPQQQRSVLTELLDIAAETGLNAVILQVRTECDALYQSNIEPWSFFLTGQMGVGPSDGYDPLRFAIQEAHLRGIELHAWFNPFRASATERSGKSSKHITRTHSSQILASGTMKWGNPGSDFIRQRAIDVMVDVTKRYDVDGVHIDDYFYPYPKTVGGRSVDQFDDSSSFRAYQSNGGKLDVRDWRRSNINSFVSSLYKSIKATKPSVDVGISPFGIWRPGFPSTIKAGLDAYDHIFADSRTWLNQGWLDYFSPQLYWRIDPPDQSFSELNRWWSGENKKGRHVWPGIASSRILSSEDKGRPASEMIRQIEVTRKVGSPSGPGHLHWSIEAIRKDRDGLRSKLRSTYADTALPPASPWLGSASPSPVYVAPVEQKGGLQLLFKPAPDARWRVIQVKNGNSWITLRAIPASQESFQFSTAPATVAIRNMSPTGILSIPTILARK